MRETGELREERRAVEPEPRDAEHRQPHDAVAVREAQVLRSVSVNGFQLIVERRVDRAASAGCARLASQPATATAIAERRRRAPARSAGSRRASPPAIVPSRIATNVPISTSPLPPTSSSALQVLRQDRVLDRPEQRRVHAHQRERDEQQRRGCGSQKPTRRHHDRDLEQLDEADQARLLVLVGELAGGGRQQHERQDEDRAGEVDERVRRRATPCAAAWKATKMTSAFLKMLSLRGAQELRPEERREAALAQQVELVRRGMRRRSASGRRQRRRVCIRANLRSISSRTSPHRELLDEVVARPRRARRAPVSGSVR